MKIYIFYKIADSTGPLGEPVLYAITDKKYLMENFKSERNMRYFLLKSFEPTDKKESLSILDKHKPYRLKTSGFTTRDKDSILQTEIIYVTTTYYEEEMTYVNSDKLFEKMGQTYHYCVEYLNKKELLALTNLHYFELCKFYSYDNPCFLEGVSDNFDNLSDTAWDVSTLKLFLYFYGNTF